MFEYLFHYFWDDEYNTPSYERWVTADNDEEALAIFYKERPNVYNMWYERYRKIKYADGYNELVLDM